MELLAAAHDESYPTLPLSFHRRVFRHEVPYTTRNAVAVEQPYGPLG
jgi:hypothetical protein